LHFGRISGKNYQRALSGGGIFLTVPFEDVDVNVHPAKMTVRFVHQGSIHQAIAQTIQKTLDKSRSVPKRPQPETFPLPETPLRNQEPQHYEETNHKGQIFPFNIITRLRSPLHAGLYSLSEQSSIYVSRGAGTWGLPVRLLAPPEVTLIELVNVKV
jgi:Predicted phosphohydrolases